MAKNICQYTDPDSGNACPNEASRKYCAIHKGEANAIRLRRSRAARKQATEELAALADTPLVRSVKGLDPLPESRFEAYNPKIHGPAMDPRGIPGQREHHPTPYGSAARKAAQRAQRQLQVIDYTTPDSMPSVYARPVSRLRGLLPSQRHDAVLRQAHEARIRAQQEGLLEEPTKLDWGFLSEHGEEAWELQQASRAAEDAGVPFEHAAHFEAPWRGRSLPNDNEISENFLYRS